ncbi:helix-turn-helix transcriptional regulator [uncultured Alloprevotella sp.]|jgi:transcriptional regulator|uniref:helix-turn-helix domain-containing protein n=1 Tax=uncultured Alloprevotella sp. TaxID=1283315 RepID=UPI0028E4B6BD|nr:helix-turn-helix transcriptional regulator [uncultured Alloprevotella sp.]
MQKKNNITDYDAILESRYGKEGSPERLQFEEEAKAFYAAQLLLQARKEAKVSQSELALRVGTTKSYISKIENGVVEPGVGLFFRLINALGLRIDITNPIGM